MYPKNRPIYNLLKTDIADYPTTSEPGDLDLEREYANWLMQMITLNDDSIKFLNALKFLWVTSMYHPQYFQPEHNLGTFVHYLLIHISRNGDAKVNCFLLDYHENY